MNIRAVRRKLLVRVTVCVVVVCAVLGEATATSGGGGGQLPSRLADISGNPVLVIQLDAAASDFGAFDFKVDGLGDYSGALTIKPRSLDAPAPFTLTFATGTFTSSGTATADFQPPSGTTRRSTHIRIAGTIMVPGAAGPSPNPLSSPPRRVSGATSAVVANLLITVDGSVYQLTTDAGTPAEAAPVVQAVGLALRQRDWNSLYLLLAADLRHTYTQAQFAALMNSKPARNIQTILVSGAGLEGVTEDGIPYYQQTVSITEQNQGAVQATIYLVREQGEWRYLSSSTP